MTKGKKALIGLVILLIVIQLFRIDKTNPEFDKNQDIAVIENLPQDVESILRTSCYDCHSYEVVYPWYTNVAPLSWWIKQHVNEGSHHLNFSEWGSYSDKRKKHKLEELLEMVEEGEMPLSSYIIMHSEGTLTSEEKDILLKWCKEKFDSIVVVEEEES